MNEHKLPEPSAGTILRPGHPREKVYTADQMRAYAEQYAAQAVAAEREACVLIADRNNNSGEGAVIADAIRARSMK